MPAWARLLGALVSSPDVGGRGHESRVPPVTFITSTPIHQLSICSSASVCYQQKSQLQWGLFEKAHQMRMSDTKYVIKFLHLSKTPHMPLF